MVVIEFLLTFLNVLFLGDEHGNGTQV